MIKIYHLSDGAVPIEPRMMTEEDYQRVVRCAIKGICRGVVQSPIERLDLSTRALNGLRYAGVVTMEDFVYAYDQGRLQRAPKVGKKCLAEYTQVYQGCKCIVDVLSQ